MNYTTMIKKTRDETLTALAKIGKPGVNCVDISQVVRQVLLDMKQGNVNKDIHGCE